MQASSSVVSYYYLLCIYIHLHNILTQCTYTMYTYTMYIVHVLYVLYRYVTYSLQSTISIYNVESVQ
jgi:hypothetical protein